ncbi:expressed unknown protein [Seminavis robusta]|uniref:ABC transmembrane type-1 domain-containing protein n=1 Tax=Seminavis robusta TaxID=568900 RepID=A0A9N8DQA3_9STRA|nr:expressed unknown protein [Seminavis robusta]|eukprot:Sro207_g086990.1 n/a (547) ;mRNA; r:87668-89412
MDNDNTTAIPSNKETPEPGLAMDGTVANAIDEADTAKKEEAVGEVGRGSTARSIEDFPWQGMSYIASTPQFMLITLDLFMDTSLSPAWHYAITSIVFALALYLFSYVSMRLFRMVVWCSRKRVSIANQVVFILWLSALMQGGILGCAAYSFFDNDDRIEWGMFGLGIVWGILHPLTFSQVAELEETINNKDGKNEKKGSGVGPATAVYLVFRHHFIRAPLLSFGGILFATVHALLTTYQGAVINELSKSVTKTDANGNLKASNDKVTELAQTLVAVWAASIAAKFIFDVISSFMFARLEVWLRRVVMERGTKASSRKTTNEAEDNGLGLADYQARYASDITATVSLYDSLLKGVVINLLLIVTNFVFLAYEEWRVACVTLGFLAMGVTSGPTSLAGKNAGETQKLATSGLSMFQEAESDDPEQTKPLPAEASSRSQQIYLVQRHEDQVLKPLEKTLFRRNFFAASVDTFINFYSTFLTAIVVIAMSWEVFNGNMDGSNFLGLFFIFKQLQKPATKLSGIIKKLSKCGANLKRVNAVVLDSPSKKED